jgi:hypothetical protein
MTSDSTNSKRCSRAPGQEPLRPLDLRGLEEIPVERIEPRAGEPFSSLLSSLGWANLQQAQDLEPRDWIRDIKAKLKKVAEPERDGFLVRVHGELGLMGLRPEFGLSWEMLEEVRDWIDDELIRRSLLKGEVQELQVQPLRALGSPHLPHTCFAQEQRRQGITPREAWKNLKSLAVRSKGTELIDLPGFGSIYLKLDARNTEAVRWKRSPFTGPSDPGEMIEVRKFKHACKPSTLRRRSRPKQT